MFKQIRTQPYCHYPCVCQAGAVLATLIGGLHHWVDMISWFNHVKNWATMGFYQRLTGCRCGSLLSIALLARNWKNYYRRCANTAAAYSLVHCKSACPDYQPYQHTTWHVFPWFVDQITSNYQSPSQTEAVGEQWSSGHAMGCTQGNVRKHAGVKDLRRTYQGSVSVRNDLEETIRIRFAEPNLLGSTLLNTQVAPGDTFEFQPGETWNFDFHTTIGDKLRAHVLRGASYAVSKTEDGAMKMQTLSRPERNRSDKLSKVKGLSFSFSASGWLVIYQLGTAECLQNHGYLALHM